MTRNNSNQSLRIGALEIENSRLLADNAALREDIIRLELQLENAGGIHVARFTEIKSNLGIKMGELNALVADLGTLQDKTNTKKPPAKPQRLCEQRVRPSKPPNVELGIDQDGRLPIIMEDKYYPRRTLGYGTVCATNNCMLTYEISVRTI